MNKDLKAELIRLLAVLADYQREYETVDPDLVYRHDLRKLVFKKAEALREQVAVQER